MAGGNLPSGRDGPPRLVRTFNVPQGGPCAPTRPALLGAGQAGMFSHPFRLRPGLVISINLSNDLTMAEAEFRIAAFRTTLAS